MKLEDLKLGDMVEIEWTDTVVKSGWNDPAKTEPVFNYGKIRQFPNFKSKKPEWEIVSMVDSTGENANQSVAIPAKSGVKIRKLQYTKGFVDLS